VVEVELPGLPIATESRSKFALDCRQPVAGKRLHLLAIGVGSQEEKPLLQRVLQALRITMDEEGRFLPSAFASVQLHGILTGPHVTRRAITSQLHLIHKKIEHLKMSDTRAAVTPLEDLVLVYYQGSELIGNKDHYLNTGGGVPTEKELTRTGITVSELRDILRDMGGAPVLLLDVIRSIPEQRPVVEPPASDRLVRWDREAPRLGFLRSRLQQTSFTPEEARLIRQLEQATKEHRILSEVVNYLVQQFNRIKADRSLQLQFDKYVPDGLLDLVIALRQ
jgi:hypothetical protein